MRALSLLCVDYWQTTSMSLDDALAAVSKLSLLTSLLFVPTAANPLPAAAAFTALTAGSNLCSLNVCLLKELTPKGCVLFRPAARYLDLRSIRINPAMWATPELEQQQLQQMCGCCPALEGLKLALMLHHSPTVLMPLVRLSVLTHLDVYNIGAEAAEVVRDVARLTGLKQLCLCGSPAQTDPALLQLTASSSGCAI